MNHSFKPSTGPRRRVCLAAALLTLSAFACHAQVKSSLAVAEALEQSAPKLVSPNKRFEFLLVPGRGLALWDRTDSKEIWTFTSPELNPPGKPVKHPPQRLALEAKGSLVLWATDGKTAVWSSRSDYAGVTKAVLDDDGDLTLQDGAGQKIWSLKDPATGKYRVDDNGVFLKYAGTGPDPSRNSSSWVNLDDLK
jgi:hypothetical protein